MKELADLVSRMKEKAEEYSMANGLKKESMTTVMSYTRQKLERETHWSKNLNNSMYMRANGVADKLVLGFSNRALGYQGDITLSIVDGEEKFNIHPNIIQRQFMSGDENKEACSLFYEGLHALRLSVRSNESFFTTFGEDIRVVSEAESREADKDFHDALKDEARILSEIDDLRAIFVYRLNNEVEKESGIEIGPDLAMTYYGQDICSLGKNPNEKAFDIDINSNEKRGWSNDIAHPRSLRTFASNQMGGLYTYFEQFGNLVHKTPAINDSVAEISQRLESKKQGSYENGFECK